MPNQNRRSLFAAVRSALILIFCCLSLWGRSSGVEPTKPSLLVAHYMPWFEADPEKHFWGWHWTMNAFDPGQTADDKRRIAAHYYPLIGPYDSGDPAVIEYHLLLMRLAGLDGLIVDWYGLADFLDYPLLHRNTQAVFRSAERLGLRVGICYEDQTIPKLVEAKRLAPDERVAHARREIDWMRKNWFAKPTYLQIDGKPVLLSFGDTGLNDEEWALVLREEKGSLLYASEHRRRSAAAGTFDWPQPQAGLETQKRYLQAEKGSTFFIPVAFPRFHDIYKEARVGEGYGRIPDEDGRTFAQTLERACESGAPLAQIATWNDWGEGTVIEPSREFGYRDLETIQRRQKRAHPALRATPADLRLPYRIWILRGRQAEGPSLASQLDALVRQIASGDLPAARAALQKIEAAALPSPR